MKYALIVWIFILACFEALGAVGDPMWRYPQTNSIHRDGLITFSPATNVATMNIKATNLIASLIQIGGVATTNYAQTVASNSTNNPAIVRTNILPVSIFTNAIDLSRASTNMNSFPGRHAVKPMMHINSWNYLGGNYSEALFLQFVTNCAKWKQFGYQYVGWGDGFYYRDANGWLTPSNKFSHPLNWYVDVIHSLGLKAYFGLSPYPTSSGLGNRAETEQQWMNDAIWIVTNNVDMVVIDGWVGHVNQMHDARRFGSFLQTVSSHSNMPCPIYFVAAADAPSLGPEFSPDTPSIANVWGAANLDGGDYSVSQTNEWDKTLLSLQSSYAASPFVGPGFEIFFYHMLGEAMNDYTNYNTTQDIMDRNAILNAIFSSTVVVNAEPRYPAQTNEAYLSINMDTLMAPPELVFTNQNIQVYKKSLQEGAYAVSLLNLSTNNTTTFTLSFTNLCLSPWWNVYDCFARGQMGTLDAVTVTIPPKHARMYKLSPLKHVGASVAGATLLYEDVTFGTNQVVLDGFASDAAAVNGLWGWNTADAAYTNSANDRWLWWGNRSDATDIKAWWISSANKDYDLATLANVEGSMEWNNMFKMIRSGNQANWKDTLSIKQTGAIILPYNSTVTNEITATIQGEQPLVLKNNANQFFGNYFGASSNAAAKTPLDIRRVQCNGWWYMGDLVTNGAVVSVRDRSVYNRPLTNSAANTTWPVRNVAAYKGHDSMVFGAGRHLSNLAFTNGAEHEVIVILKYNDSLDAQFRRVFSGGSTSYEHVLQKRDTGVSSITAIGYTLNSGPFVTNQWLYYDCVFSSGGGGTFTNNVIDYPLTVTSGGVGMSGFILATYSDYASTFAAPIEVVEVVSFNGVLTKPERDALYARYTEPVAYFYGNGSGLTNVPTHIIAGTNIVITTNSTSSHTVSLTSSVAIPGVYYGDGSGITNSYQTCVTNAFPYVNGVGTVQIDISPGFVPKRAEAYFECTTGGDGAWGAGYRIPAVAQLTATNQYQMTVDLANSRVVHWLSNEAPFIPTAPASLNPITLTTNRWQIVTYIWK